MHQKPDYLQRDHNRGVDVSRTSCRYNVIVTKHACQKHSQSRSDSKLDVITYDQDREEYETCVLVDSLSAAVGCGHLDVIISLRDMRISTTTPRRTMGEERRNPRCNHR